MVANAKAGRQAKRLRGEAVKSGLARPLQQSATPSQRRPASRVLLRCCLLRCSSGPPPMLMQLALPPPPPPQQQQPLCATDWRCCQATDVLLDGVACAAVPELLTSALTPLARV